jgi:hypothetical protein
MKKRRALVDLPFTLGLCLRRRGSAHTGARDRVGRPQGAPFAPQLKRRTSEADTKAAGARHRGREVNVRSWWKETYERSTLRPFLTHFCRRQSNCFALRDSLLDHLIGAQHH